ncbi:MAG: hypothetical protein U9P42_09805, partial [Candidatus Fermentibacteria bacterium]|nr:hypothetical protein [Candidatus Fermentibacteria bacterium]
MILTLLTILATSNFSGTWETTYGDMVLEQNGSSVTGWYSYGTMSTIEGTVTDSGKLIFTYDEVNVSGSGWFQLSEGGNSFSGQWRAEGVRTWSGWEGHRATGEPSTWVLILEAE